MASALEAQNARYAKSPARDAHLRALRAGAAAVVTGQQVGLFLGPLYTVYKAASTIRLARRLAEQWGAPVVPVFWLQTEDHDAAEIALCHVARESGEPLTLALEVADDGVSVAHRVLPAAVLELLAKLGGEIARLPHGEEHLACLARHYRPGAGWAEAFAAMMSELFAGEGLVLLDPRDPALAALAAPVHRRALTQARPIARALAGRVRELESAGWAAPVHVREDAPLSFFHPDGPEGRRCRLAAAENGFVEVGRSRARTLEELLGVLDATPAAFSTSALLRPILQDTWLPTVAYVGGPGEVAYFAQMAPLYAAFELPMPVIVPRVRLRLLDEETRRAMARTGADSSGEPGGALVARRLVDGVDRVLAEIAPRLREAGGRAERSIEKTRRTVARSAARLGRDYDRARLSGDPDAIESSRRVRALLMPRGIPQERFFGLPSFAARYGQRSFVQRVLAAAEPLATGLEDLEL